MIALWIIIGIVIGSGGYYLYDKYLATAEKYVESEAGKIKAKL